MPVEYVHNSAAKYFFDFIMDSLPPNDNNNNNNNNNNGRRLKEQPWDGRSAGRGGSTAGAGGSTQDGQPMDIMGNMNDSPAAVVMFLVGVAAWLLRERCVC